MKTKIFTIAATALLSLGLTACGNDCLDVSSKTETSTGNYYKSQNDADRALIGCYDGWQGTVSLGPTFTFQMAAEYMSDECFGGTGANDGRNSQVVDRFDISQDASQTNIYNDLWEYYYKAIYNCNELLLKTQGTQWSSDAVKGRILGETRAIRALCYFDMVRMFEHIPLLTTPTDENVPQADPDSVYALIVNDLTYAADNIPANAYPKSQAAANDGRITKYAAEAMLARVYLFYDGVYNNNERKEMPGGLTASKALAGLEDVIGSGEYSLVPQFKNLWPAASDNWVQDAAGNWTNDSTYAGDGNSETVLSMKFNYTGDYNGNNAGNRSIVMFGMRTGGTICVPYGQGWGGATVTTATWNDFATGDSRQSASIINMAQEGITQLDAWKKVASDQREYTGFTSKKYTPRSKWTKGTDGSWSMTHYYQGLMAGDFQISQPQDYVLMRYSDVLLMAAELGSPKAQTYFNEVRKRAFTQSDGTLSNGYRELPATESNILRERKLEFVGEGIRYWDLLRQGIDVAANTIAASGERVISGGREETVTIKAENIKSKRGFCQIPLTQIQRSNNLLKQNAGW